MTITIQSEKGVVTVGVTIYGDDGNRFSFLFVFYFSSCAHSPAAVFQYGRGENDATDENRVVRYFFGKLNVTLYSLIYDEEEFLSISVYFIFILLSYVFRCTADRWQ